jgi:serine/threonine protein kinase
VHDVGDVDGRPFIVMEFIAGQSLRDALSAERMKLRQIVEIGCQVADGLAAAHRAGVVHRDLKPRNIMLAEDGRAKIVDFGLGKIPAAVVAAANDVTTDVPALTSGHVVLGTVGYMSPEQVCGRPVTFQADQFALGAVLYEMISGQRAFKRNTPVEIMAAVMESEPPPLDRNPSTPSDLITIVERCPKDANGQCVDLARALRRCPTRKRPAGHRRHTRCWHAADVCCLPSPRPSSRHAIPSCWLATRAPVWRRRGCFWIGPTSPDIDAALALLEPVIARGSGDPAALLASRKPTGTASRLATGRSLPRPPPRRA